MSSKFRTWLRVTPPPTTLAESSAIFKRLKSQGRVSAFMRATQPDARSESGSNSRSTSYYIVFSHEPPRLKWNFDVPVYHDVPNPRDEDPYNIRGLQDRKPFPASRIFTCTLEPAGQNAAPDEELRRNNPYHGPFKVEKNDWFQEVLGETGAPPGIQQGLGIVAEGLNEEEARGGRFTRKIIRQRRIRMDSLMEPWREATGLEPPMPVRRVVRDPKAVVRKVGVEKEESADTAGESETLTRIDPDVPLGARI